MKEQTAKCLKGKKNPSIMGLEVKLIIAKKQQQEDEEVPVASRGDDGGGGGGANTDDSSVEFDMQVESTGKFSRKANWEDLNQFTGKEITSEVLRDMVVTYQKKCFPDGEFLELEQGTCNFLWKPCFLVMYGLLCC